MTPSDSSQDTKEIRIDDPPPGDETPERHLISWALSIIENAPRCLIGVEPTGEGLHGERLEWIEARDGWRAAYQAWAATVAARQPETIENPDAPRGMLLTSPGIDQTENERLVLHAQTVAANTGQPVRVVRRSPFGGSLDVQIGGVQMRADGAK